MIPLDKAIEMLGDCQNKLRNATAICSPMVISEQMMRLSQYTGILDEYLADIEKSYEIKLSHSILQKVNSGEYKVSPAETLSKMEMAETRGQILYLTRIVNSAWKQVGVAQSRYNHLLQESKNNI